MLRGNIPYNILKLLGESPISKVYLVVDDDGKKIVLKHIEIESD